jgi:hypothetical protein
MKPSDSDSKHKILPSEIVKIVDQQLPHWRAACDHAGADTVFLNQRAFGHSDDELFLLAVAIKYAGIAKKNVTIAPD